MLAAGSASSGVGSGVRAGPLPINRCITASCMAVDEAIAQVGGLNVHAASSWRAGGAGRWSDTPVRFVGDPAAAAAMVFDGYRDVPPDWLPPVTGSPLTATAVAIAVL